MYSEQYGEQYGEQHGGVVDRLRTVPKMDVSGGDGQRRGGSKPKARRKQQSASRASGASQASQASRGASRVAKRRPRSAKRTQLGRGGGSGVTKGARSIGGPGASGGVNASGTSIGKGQRRHDESIMSGWGGWEDGDDRGAHAGGAGGREGREGGAGGEIDAEVDSSFGPVSTLSAISHHASRRGGDRGDLGSTQRDSAEVEELLVAHQRVYGAPHSRSYVTGQRS